MSTIGQEIIAGLTEAVGYMDGTADRAQYGVHDFPPASAPERVDVKAIRQKLASPRPSLPLPLACPSIPCATGNRADGSPIRRHGPICVLSRSPRTWCGGRCVRHDLAEVLAWIADNRGELMTIWRNYHP